MVRARSVPCCQALFKNPEPFTRCGDSIRYGIAACQIIEQGMVRYTAFRIFIGQLEREISCACFTKLMQEGGLSAREEREFASTVTTPDEPAIA